MPEILSFNEYPPEKVFEAQDMYCVDRLTYEAVSGRTGVSVATLKRWSDKYGWRAKREELAKAESDIRADTFKARAKMLAKVVDTADHFAAFAVAKLETMALEQAKFAAEQARESSPAPVFIEGPAQAAALLESALAQKMGALLSAPGTIDLKTIKDLRECLKLVEEMRGRAAEETDKQTGLTQETEERIKKILAGDL